MKTFHEWMQQEGSFFEKRKAGAQKIAKQAAEKGGPSQLTAWHFSAKLPEYDRILKMREGVNASRQMKSECDQLLSKLRGLSKMSQKEFQEIMGNLRFGGSVLLR